MEEEIVCNRWKLRLILLLHRGWERKRETVSHRRVVPVLEVAHETSLSLPSEWYEIEAFTAGRL